MGPNAKVKQDKQCEVTSTQQLLADLTNDFEETITAQICLSNQLLDANLEKVETAKDILILKSESAAAVVSDKQLPMESNISISATTASTTNTSTNDTTPTTTDAAQNKAESFINDAVEQDLAESKSTAVATSSAVVEVEEALVVNTVPDATHVDEPADVALQVTPPNSSLELTSTLATAANVFDNAAESLLSSPASSARSAKHDASRPTIISVEELPPIRTDSTMTASEVEDNIEERLSQLDGTAVQPLTGGDDPCNSEPQADAHIINTIPATPPRTPPPPVVRSQQPQTPTTPLIQQLQLHQQHSFTPQSSTSSVTTMGSTNIPKDFLKDSSAGELEDPDIEEVLKALKGLDSSAPADTICDLNVLFNEVYTTLNCDDIRAESQSNCTSNSNSVNAAHKPNQLQEAQAEIEKKQQSMQRKIDFMLRRLRKIQARYMSKHSSEEISGLFEWSAQIVNKNVQHTHDTDVNEYQQLNYVAEKTHPVTSLQMSTMLRKIEVAANAQQLSTTTSAYGNVNMNRRKTTVPMSSKKLVAGAGAASSTTSDALAADRNNVVPSYDVKVTAEIAHVTGLLQTELHEVQHAIDSDATESSSGGESADEMVTYNNVLQQPLQIAKRAAWRYSRDRAAIAARWSWLLSQISDLQIKIGKHRELHQESIRSKGPAMQGIPNHSHAATAMSFNGYKGSTQSCAVESKDISAELGGCCRTRGILASNFRKRKLFQTTNIHTFSKKAARPSTIKCGCQWPLHPCALCTGRTDPTAPRDLPDTMMMADRVALLDPGYHPVLSFPEDITNSIHFEAIARLPEWQQRVMRCPVKHIAKSVWKAEREAAAHAVMSKKNADSSVKRKYVKKKDLNKDLQQHHSNNGNGTGNLSSTPLVANKLMKNSKQARYAQATDDSTMMPKQSPARMNHHNSNQSQSSNSNNNLFQQHQQQSLTMSEYHQQNYAPYNHNQTHSSSISSTVRNSKNRKLSSSAINSTFHQYNHHSSNENNHYGSNSEFNYLHSDSWDSLVNRSRTSSPTHGGSGSKNSKYERSLDRRNRTSYDIDNIVIPYSVAAATRVELLPYKEIPTPKWRVVDNEIDPEVNATTDASCNAANLKSADDNDLTLNDEVCNNNNNTIETPPPLNSLPQVSNAEDAAATAAVVDDDAEKQHKVNNNVNHSCLNNVAATTESNTAAAAVGDTGETANTTNTNKCRLTTKRTYSEKENSVDPIDTIKDSDATHTDTVKTTPTTGSMGEESVAKKAKTEVAELKQQQPQDDEPKKDEVKWEKQKVGEANVLATQVKLNNIQKQQPQPVLAEGVDRANGVVTKNVKEISNNNNNESMESADDDGVEDITDEAMILRHERALIEERRKFQTFLKFPWSTRSRANRRIDSRAESSGANTPDPASPAPNTPSVGGGDLDSIPSPAAPSTPLNPLDSIAESCESTALNSAGILNNSIAPPPSSMQYSNSSSKQRYERRRTTSAKKDREQERRSSTPDPKELIPPYEPLQFPISNDVFEHMVKMMPADHHDDDPIIENFNLAHTTRSTKHQENSLKTDSLVKQRSISNASDNKKTSRLSNNSITRRDVGSEHDLESVGITEGEREEEEQYEDDVDDDDDGYPKHHLAPAEDAYDAYEDDVSYEPRRKNHMEDDSEIDSSEAEPFSDDDPNDPEWKGETVDKDKLRRKI